MTSMNSHNNLGAASSPYPSPALGWYMVVLLTAVYILSFLDRYILGLLIEPIKADLGLSDTQVGLLLGPSFALFYAIMGLPLGWLADRKRRTWIITAGLTLWSAATALSGLARNFGQLFLARMSVGVGEATLSPCAMSLIADSFPKSKRGKPIAVYSTAMSVGGGIAALVGAAVISWAMRAEAIDWPMLGALKPWQVTMIAVGLPGLLLAPLVMILKEPVRRADTALLGTSQVGYKTVFRYLRPRWKVFTGFVSIFCFMIIVGYSTTWGAATFSRNWGWSPVQYGQALGALFLTLGTPTVLFGGWLSDRWFQKGRKDAPLLVAMIGVPIMILGGSTWPLLSTATAALAPLGLMVIGAAFTSATGVTALLSIIASDIRGKAVAIYYMITSLFGLGFGPLSVGLLNDYVFGPEQIRYSMALLPVIFGLPVLLLLPSIRRRYLAEYDAVNPAQEEHADRVLVMDELAQDGV